MKVTETSSFIYCYLLCSCWVEMASPCAHGGQKRELDPRELDLFVGLSCGWCWDLNSGPHDVQQVLLVIELSLQSLIFLFRSCLNRIFRQTPSIQHGLFKQVCLKSVNSQGNNSECGGEGIVTSNCNIK